MATKTTANFATILSWSQIDTNTFSRVCDLGEVSTDLAFMNYTGSIPSSIDSVWYETGVLPSGGSVKIDLQALSRVVFGETVTISLNRVMGLIVKNVNQTDGDVFSISTTGSNPFSDIFAGEEYTVPIYPAASLGFTKPTSGWAVTGANNEIFLDDGGQGCSYEIGIIGFSG